MNKKITKVAALSVGLAMAIGVGVALGSKGAKAVKAETEDITYTVADYPAGTQYATNESHVLDSTLTLITNGCHFTSEIRMYQDTETRTNWVQFNSLRKISGLKINANCNTKSQTNVLQLKGSNDGGANYTDIDTQSTAKGTSYGDITFSFAADTDYKTLLLKNIGSYQTRVKTITVTYVKEAVVVSGVTVSGPSSVTSGYLGYKNIQLSADVQYSSGQGDESVTWSSSSSKNTVNENGVLHITANESTTITATSKEDSTKSNSLTISISGLVERTFSKETVQISTSSQGTSNIVSETAGSPVEITSGNVKFSIDKASSTSKPGYYADPAGIRVYQGATLTISTVDGNGMSFLSLLSVSAGGYQLSAATVSLSAGTFTIDENGVAFIDLSSSPSSSLVLTANAQFRFDVAYAYYYEQTDKEAVDEFVANYMHMSDYTEEKGWCSDEEHHYYADAKAAFNGLNYNRRELFMTGEDYVAARARLSAWAAANHDLIDENYSIIKGAFMGYDEINSGDNNGIMIIVITIASVSALAFTTLLLLKKRKQK